MTMSVIGSCVLSGIPKFWMTDRRQKTETFAAALIHLIWYQNECNDFLSATVTCTFLDNWKKKAQGIQIGSEKDVKEAVADTLKEIPNEF